MNELKNGTAPCVWGLFNGERGGELPALSRREGPFPPQAGANGWISIGWPAVGHMNMWANDYKTYFQKFQVVHRAATNRTMATSANMPWYFAFEMKINDWVICPCSSERLLFIGQIIGDYEASWGETPGLRPDFIHFRRVRWSHIIPASDPRYGQLNRIGQLTLSRQKLTVGELQRILNGTTSAEAA